MTERLKKEKEQLLRDIDEERNRLVDLEENNLNKSFGKFFVKPLFLALIFGLILKYLGLKDNAIVGGFLIAFFVSLFVFSYKTKKDFEKRSKDIQEEKIKIQANIFAMAKRLGEID